MKKRFRSFRFPTPATRLQWGRYPTTKRVYDLSGEPVVSGPRSVLLLEDAAGFCRTLRLFLQSHSFRVTCVANGVEGVRQIMANDFDVILCDLGMPNMPGDMFYLAVERTKPHLCQRIVFMTGHQADPKWDGFIRKVGGLVLWKPFLLSDMLTGIQNILNKNLDLGR